MSAIPPTHHHHHHHPSCLSLGVFCQRLRVANPLGMVQEKQAVQGTTKRWIHPRLGGERVNN